MSKHAKKQDKATPVDESLVAALVSEALTFPGDDPNVGDWEAETGEFYTVTTDLGTVGNVSVKINGETFLVSVYKVRPE